MRPGRAGLAVVLVVAAVAAALAVAGERRAAVAVPVVVAVVAAVHLLLGRATARLLDQPDGMPPAERARRLRPGLTVVAGFVVLLAGAAAAYALAEGRLSAATAVHLGVPVIAVLVALAVNRRRARG